MKAKKTLYKGIPRRKHSPEKNLLPTSRGGAGKVTSVPPEGGGGKGGGGGHQDIASEP